MKYAINKLLAILIGAFMVCQAAVANCAMLKVDPPLPPMECRIVGADSTQSKILVDCMQGLLVFELEVTQRAPRPSQRKCSECHTNGLPKRPQKSFPGRKIQI